MAATISSSTVRVLNAQDVRALLRQPAASGRTQEFLRALVGSMSAQEVDALELRIQRTAEGIDDRGDTLR